MFRIIADNQAHDDLDCQYSLPHSGTSISQKIRYIFNILFSMAISYFNIGYAIISSTKYFVKLHLQINWHHHCYSINIKMEIELISKSPNILQK